MPPTRTAPRLDLGLLALAVSDDVGWRRSVRFDPDQRWYARVAATATYEAWLLSWLPGQGTGPHDHGGSAGAFLVLRGELAESSYALGSATAPTQRLGTGSVRRFGPRHIHDVRNVGAVPAVSLHVYAPALRAMTRYGWEEGALVARSREKAGSDW
nr:cysteine dioxygenase family protein [Motilibacter aurantiacus]